MRFLRLGLDRYGSFTEREIVFDPAARVVVVEGANEAGKTTALHAAGDALFGIDERSRFNFLHDYRDMRVSATLADAAGNTLSFARLKRRRGTLIDPASGEPLPDDALAPFLGAHQRASFLEIFGLDQKRLRRGGEELLAGGGDLAEALIAAAPGLNRVVALRDRLAERAGRVFNPARRNSAHAFYQALDRRKTARDGVRDHELRADVVRQHRTAVEAALSARTRAVEIEVAAAQAALWADLLCRAAGIMRRIEAAEAAIATLGPLPELPVDYARQARDALAALAVAQATHARAVEEEARAQAALAAVAEDAPILALGPEVEACDEERAAVQRAREHLPRREAEAAEARAALSRIAVDLGLSGVDALRASLPATPLLARGDALADAAKALAQRAAQIEADAATQVRDAAELDAARAGLGAVDDPAPLRRRLAALDGAEERARGLASGAARCDATWETLEARARRLGLGDLDALCALPLPALAAAEALAATVAGAADAVARRDEVLADLAAQRDLAALRHAELDGGGTAPTDAALAAARATRDALWDGLRGVATGERAATPQDQAAARALDGAIPAADRIADERQRAADRLAALARSARDIDELDLRLAAARNARTDAAGRLAAAHADWRDLLAPCRIDWPPDARGLALIKEAQALVEARDALRRQAAEAAPDRAAVERDRFVADELRRDLGLPPLGAAPLHMGELRDAVEQIERRHRLAHDQARDAARLERDRADLDRRRAALAQDRAALAAEADDVLPRLAIRPGAPAEEVRAALGLWRSAQTLSATLATAEHRASAIVREAEAFAARVVHLASRAGEGEGDALATARRLRARLDAARQAEARAQSAREALEARRAASREAAQALARGEAAVAALRTAAGDPPADRFPALLDDLDAHMAGLAELEAARRQLADLCRNRDAAAVRAGLAGQDDATLDVRAQAAEAEAAVARRARDEAVARHAEAEAALRALEAREGAAHAAQEEQDANAALAESVEAFSRDHAAALLLSRAVDRYREAHQNPIVTRAAAAFATLTLGRWSGIAVDYEAPTPRLGAVREGRLHGVDGLSEGTADQLFLALRVAAVEEHARRAAPLPFMADDLFVTFDETRTEAGLRLLAELGALTQVIVFTHHRHVGEAAEHALGAACQRVRL